MELVMILMLVFTLACALFVAFTRNLLTAAIVFMGQSLAMSIIWMLLQSPDLAITEAAVGAGISGTLFLLTLRRIRAEENESGTEGET